MRCAPRSRVPATRSRAARRRGGARDRGGHLIGHLLARGSATQEGAARGAGPSKWHPHGPPRRHPTQEERVGASFLRAAAGKYVPAHHATLEGGPSTRACWSTGRLARCTMRGGGGGPRLAGSHSDRPRGPGTGKMRGSLVLPQADQGQRAEQHRRDCRTGQVVVVGQCLWVVSRNESRGVLRG